ncbi:hypothetical protein ACPA0F_02800 [Solibacillus silvestris]
MKFNYKITDAGWARCELESSNQQFSFEASCISDALKEFLEAILRFNPDIDSEFYEDETECSWHQEPGLIEWVFNISDIKSTEENLFFTVKQYEDDSRKHRPFINMKLSCNYDKFVASIVTSLEALLTEFGLVGYSEMWDGADFPIACYLKLKQYTINKSVVPTVTETTDDSLKTTTSLDYELNLIAKNLNI